MSFQKRMQFKRDAHSIFNSILYKSKKLLPLTIEVQKNPFVEQNPKYTALYVKKKKSNLIPTAQSQQQTSSIRDSSKKYICSKCKAFKHSKKRQKSIFSPEQQKRQKNIYYQKESEKFSYQKGYNSEPLTPTLYSSKENNQSSKFRQRYNKMNVYQQKSKPHFQQRNQQSDDSSSHRSQSTDRSYSSERSQSNHMSQIKDRSQIKNRSQIKEESQNKDRSQSSYKKYDRSQIRIPSFYLDSDQDDYSRSDINSEIENSQDVKQQIRKSSKFPIKNSFNMNLF